MAQAVRAPGSPDVRRARLLIRAQRIAREKRQAEEADWRVWLGALFPYLEDFAPHHEEFWEWLWRVELGQSQEPFVGIWAREGGKSTSAEIGVASVGLRGVRKYGLYVRGTQENADNSVSNIAAILESKRIEKRYPGSSDRKIGKYGHSKGWRRNRLWTAGGFVVDAVGLDTAVRGLKVEEERPDFIILDDIDEQFDTSRATKKKVDTITHAILAAGTDSTVVVGIQNTMISDGVFAQLADGRAEFLIDRKVSGPIPAIQDLQTEREYDPVIAKVRTRIVGGTPTWKGQDIPKCQKLIDRIGYGTFLTECQHEVDEVEGALWNKAMIRHQSVEPEGGYIRVVVGVDPSGGKAEIGIIAVGLGRDGRGYVCADYTAEGKLGSHHWGAEAARAYDDFTGDMIAAEGNFGGDMVVSNIRVVAPNVPVKLVHASRGKIVRAEPVASLYTDERVVHIGEFPQLEKEMRTYVAGDESPNRLDALVWALTELMLEGPRFRMAVVG